IKVVPVPAAVWLFGSGFIGLVGVARRKKSVELLKQYKQRRRLRSPFLFVLKVCCWPVTVFALHYKNLSEGS
ncbi:MAG: VPLPA-CTERM sorting domain-containing protein, partial [Pseudomonadota bacterium]